MIGAKLSNRNQSQGLTCLVRKVSEISLELQLPRSTLGHWGSIHGSGLIMHRSLPISGIDENLSAETSAKTY
jgi:hypothetical protein